MADYDYTPDEDDAGMTACPTCGADGDAPCTTFGWVRYGVPTERYECEPHALRTLAPTYWRAVGIRLALATTTIGGN